MVEGYPPRLASEEKLHYKNTLQCKYCIIQVLQCNTSIMQCNTLEKAMATHSSVLAWRIPGTGEPSGLPFMGSHRVGHD